LGLGGILSFPLLGQDILLQLSHEIGKQLAQKSLDRGSSSADIQLAADTLPKSTNTSSKIQVSFSILRLSSDFSLSVSFFDPRITVSLEESDFVCVCPSEATKAVRCYHELPLGTASLV
jgi:hypothetical protein